MLNGIDQLVARQELAERAARATARSSAPTRLERRPRHHRRRLASALRGVADRLES